MGTSHSGCPNDRIAPRLEAVYGGARNTLTGGFTGLTADPTGCTGRKACPQIRRDRNRGCQHAAETALHGHHRPVSPGQHRSQRILQNVHTRIQVVHADGQRRCGHLHVRGLVAHATCSITDSNARMGISPCRTVSLRFGSRRPGRRRHAQAVFEDVPACAAAARSDGGLSRYPDVARPLLTAARRSRRPHR